MNKVICDVCGTAYPETSSQCPICGSAKVVNDQTAAGTSSEESSYTFVKGGRFSKRNVRRRTGKPSRPERVAPQKQEQAEEEETSKALIVVVIVLLLCIVAVAVYLGVRYFLPAVNDNDLTNPPATTQPTELPTDPDIPCTEIKLTHGFVDLLEEGDVFQITVTKTPANATDEVTYETSDPDVAIVLENGEIFAVGPGEAIITVKCGSAEATCYVNCLFVEEEPTDEPSDEPIEPDDPNVGPEVNPGIQFVFNCHYKFDVTLKLGQTWNAFDKNLGIEASDVQWSVVDPSICTVDSNGVVTTLKTGNTKLTAVWNGATYTCVVRVTK